MKCWVVFTKTETLDEKEDPDRERRLLLTNRYAAGDYPDWVAVEMMKLEMEGERS